MSAIGQPIPRADGDLKVSGGAAYTADIHCSGAVRAVIAQSTIANGRIKSIDTRAAEEAGVLAGFSHRNLPRVNPTPHPPNHHAPPGQSYLPLHDDKNHHGRQPVARLVAATLDQAAHAGTLIKVDYEPAPPAAFNSETAKAAIAPPQFIWPVASSVGDADKGFADAAVRIEQTYRTADRHHNQMEPHATTAM